MVTIQLISGEITLVDDEFSYLSRYVWYRSPGKNTNYARAKILGEWTMLHRLIMKTPKGLFVDHIDGNGLNNQKSNLRNVTMRENNLWRARICGKGREKPISLGLFTDVHDAAKAYDDAAKLYFGEFARLNFPEVGVS